MKKIFIQKFKHNIVLIYFIIFLYSSIFNANLPQTVSKKLSQINFTKEQISSIEILISSSVSQGLPQEPVINFVNESIAKKGSYEKMYSALKNLVNSLSLAKSYITQIKTEKFYPKDVNYSISLLSKLILAGLTEEEYTKIMALLSSQNFKFEDAIAMLNYYLIFKNYLPTKMSEINNPAEIIFMKYFTRPIKEMSCLTQTIVRCCQSNEDKQHLYNLLYKNSNLSTSKLINKIKSVIGDKFKTELKQEISDEQQYEQRKRF